ncbi:MAG: hypothetical protein EA424_04955 [Planctomycetaceae bacterium]|nr:MAG: hypothetical protein EA424_04955 [Planctomycetaceae bacterium]
MPSGDGGIAARLSGQGLAESRLCGRRGSSDWAAGAIDRTDSGGQRPFGNGHGEETIRYDLFSKGRPKNYLEHQHIDRIAGAYQAWKAEESLSAVVTKAEAVKNDYNLSPSRYVATGGKEEVLSLDEAVVLLAEAEEERAEADRELDKMLAKLGFKGCWDG